MAKATCKMNFNVQFIINRIDFILFAANVHLVVSTLHVILIKCTDTIPVTDYCNNTIYYNTKFSTK